MDQGVAQSMAEAKHLELPLRWHDLGVDAGDVDSRIHACFQVRLHDVARNGRPRTSTARRAQQPAPSVCLLSKAFSGANFCFNSLQSIPCTSGDVLSDNAQSSSISHTSSTSRPEV